MTKTTVLVGALMALVAGAAQATDVGLALSPLERWQADPAAVIEDSEVRLEDFLWLARPVVVFADTQADPRFRQQIELLAERPEELIERDVVVIVDTDPAARSAIRRELRPRGFMLALVAKDGTVMLRKPFPWDVREISRSIDKMPMRQQEIRDAKRGR